MNSREAAQKERLKASLARLMAGRAGPAGDAGAAPSAPSIPEAAPAEAPADVSVATGEAVDAAPVTDTALRARSNSSARLAELRRLGSQEPGEPIDLTGVELRRYDLSGLDLSFVTFVDADLSQANLSGATLLNADLRGATLYQASLEGAELTGSDLSGANLDRVRAKQACFGMTAMVDTSLSSRTSPRAPSRRPT